MVAMDSGGINVWLRWIGEVLKLDCDKDSQRSLPRFGRRLLLAGRSVEAQTGHTDFSQEWRVTGASQ